MHIISYVANKRTFFLLTNGQVNSFHQLYLRSISEDIKMRRHGIFHMIVTNAPTELIFEGVGDGAY